jgi:SAM-dependent methyltransferase
MSEIPIKVFGQIYADQYDLLYTDKDYEAECVMIEEVFRRYGQGDVKTVLDLGCGTGNHAIPLARRGYRVTGVDLSADMLVHAREKAAGIQLPEGSAMPMFIQGDVRNVDLGQKFDAVLMMFAVLGYQLTNEDVLATLLTVRRHLKPGGLFMSDVWYGPAVLAIRPCERVKITSIADGKVIRAASGQLDIYNHWADVHYHVWRLSGQQVVSESEETHRMRFFFPQELAFFANQAHLRLTHMWSFDDLEKSPNESTWNAMFVAHALPQKDCEFVR